MTGTERFKRYILFIISLFFAAMGVAVTKHVELGVSPISSVANVLSSTDGPLPLGSLFSMIICIGVYIYLIKRKQPV